MRRRSGGLGRGERLRRRASPSSVERMGGLERRTIETLKPLRLVVVSPSDVSAERDLVPEVLEQLNQGVCADRGLRIIAYRWEKNAYPRLWPAAFRAKSSIRS